jgi:hypothetical protein
MELNDYFWRPTKIKPMKKSVLKIILTGVLGIAVSVSAIAQQRYLDEIFTTVNVQPGVYGQGVYIFSPNVEDVGILLQGPSPTNPVLGDLNMDVYTPEGDSETARAAVIVLHTGNFLPRYFNQSTTGSRQDSSVVTLCNKLAKRGFVAMAINYRLGWNPLSDQAEVRRSTLLNAVYRGLHDVKTAVRYLKSSVDNGNAYGVDPAKITVFGFGTGGYLASNYVALDRIEELQLEKFVNGQGELFVNTALVGNVDGSGGNPAVNVINHAGYCNDVMVAVNAGGAVGDSTWIEAGEAPMISFHCPDDPFAPFDFGTVIVPTTQEDVVQVSGSKFIIKRANVLGNNDVFAGPYNDPYSIAANTALSSNHPALGLNPANYQGLFPFRRPTLPAPPDRREASPWDFWSPQVVEATIAGINNLVPPESQLNAQVILASSLNNNPDMSSAKGRAYLDSIVGYMCPRLVQAMATAQEPANCVPVLNSVQEIVETNTFIYPNPANDVLTIRTVENIIINGVEIFSITGALVASEFGINTLSRQLSVAGLTTGMYVVRVTTDKGVVTRKLLKD